MLPKTAIVIPPKTYANAISTPKVPNRTTIAAKLIIGETKRKVIIIPKGMPAETKPKNNGMVEQVQNGEIIPKITAKKYPNIEFFPFK